MQKDRKRTWKTAPKTESHEFMCTYIMDRTQLKVHKSEIIKYDLKSSEAQLTYQYRFNSESDYLSRGFIPRFLIVYQDNE